MLKPWKKSSGHLLTIDACEDQIIFRITCSEPEGSWCRMTCTEFCPSWEKNHEHELVDSGECLAQEWFDNTSVIESHVGRHSVTNGMTVDVWWDNNDGWVWGIK